MKNLIIIILAIHCSLFPSISFSQPCLPDGITFSTQADIDNFQTNYPNCTEIGGDVIISGPFITNLNGLSVLTSIEGSLIIGFSDVGTSLINLTGLEGLTYIGGDLFIGSNNALTSLTGLDNLTFINGNFTLGVLGLQLPGGNPLLTNLTGLGSLTSIGGRLSISSNNALVSLNGLDNLETIPDLYITYNSSLSSCEAQWLCDYIANPNGSINIYNNAPGCNNPYEVADSCGITLPCLPYGNYYFFTQAEIDNFPTNYPNCTEIEGDVRIDGDGITSLNGLSVLTSIGGDLIIGNDGSNNWPGNSNLTNLMGLEGLTSLGGSLNIDYNNILTSLTGLDNLTSIGGDLKVNYNFNLTSLTGLDNVTSIGGDLHIWDNITMTDLSGLDNVTLIGGVLTITYNNSLANCEAQWLCEYLANPNGSVNIFSNAPGCNNPPEIANNCGITLPCLPFGNYYFFTQVAIDNFSINYPNCTTMGGDVNIRGNDISNLNGLNGVNSIGGDLMIKNNDTLASLTGLDNLTSIEGDLYIGGHSFNYGNPNLTSLAGLDNVTLIGGDLTITYNNSLATCDVQSICNYLDDPNGEIEIHANIAGCNTQGLVEEACATVTVQEINKADNYSIYPNPVKDITSFSSEEIISFELYDMMGAMLIRRNSNSIDMTNLNPGIYFVIGFDKKKLPLYKGKIIKN